MLVLHGFTEIHKPFLIQLSFYCFLLPEVPFKMWPKRFYFTVNFLCFKPLWLVFCCFVGLDGKVLHAWNCLFIICLNCIWYSKVMPLKSTSRTKSGWQKHWMYLQIFNFCLSPLYFADSKLFRAEPSGINFLAKHVIWGFCKVLSCNGSLLM